MENVMNIAQILSALKKGKTVTFTYDSPNYKTAWKGAFQYEIHGKRGTLHLCALPLVISMEEYDLNKVQKGLDSVKLTYAKDFQIEQFGTGFHEDGAYHNIYRRGAKRVDRMGETYYAKVNDVMDINESQII